MRGVDFHTHCFPDQVADQARAALEAGYAQPLRAHPTLAHLRAGLAEAGLGLAAIMSVATKPAQVRSIARWAEHVNAQSPCWRQLKEGRIPVLAELAEPDILCFASLHPASDDVGGDVAFLRERGLLGVKFQPYFQQFEADSPEALALYRQLAPDFLCVFHSGQEFPPRPYLPCTPRHLRRILDEVPGLTLVAAHLGGYQVWEDVRRYLLGQPIYFDMSYTLGDLPDDEFVDMVRAHGVERVLFGTDWPLRNQRKYLERLLALPLTDGEKQALLQDNALRLLAQKLGAPAIKPE